MELENNLVTMISIVSSKGMLIKWDLMSKLVIIKLSQSKLEERRSLTKEKESLTI